MKTLSLLVINLVLVGAFSVAAFGQTGTPKIAVINTQAFFAQGGIKKYEVEYKKLELEFKSDITGIQKLSNEVDALRKEIEAMQEASKTVPVKPEALGDKAKQWEDKSAELKLKQEDYKRRLNRREQELVQPINVDIGKRITEFAKQKGFDMIFDVAKLDRDGSILYVAAPVDMTKDFIAFYNALPAGTATR